MMAGAPVAPVAAAAVAAAAAAAEQDLEHVMVCIENYCTWLQAPQPQMAGKQQQQGQNTPRSMLWCAYTGATVLEVQLVPNSYVPSTCGALTDTL
jgi:hypothetical protein